MKMLARSVVVALGFTSALTLASCSTAPDSQSGKMELESQAHAKLISAERADPTLEVFLRNAAGYAVFPSIGKGAAVVGGAYGKGVLYERGVVTGYCDMTQASFGLALGGQNYAEIVSFQTPDAISAFKTEKLAFDAQASGVAIRQGAGANAKFHQGVAVFTFDESGLMGEASLGGQKFTYQPK